MTHPPPHAFSRSPVEEVFCRCTVSPKAKSLSLAIPAPYPGWPDIREQIGDMIAGAGETSRITGCILRYTDIFPVNPGIALPGIEDLEEFLSRNYHCKTGQDEIVFTSRKIPLTAGSVRSVHNQGKPGWTLMFTVHIERPGGFLSRESVLEWFDDARAEIHGLFDLIVPEEIVQILR